MEGIGVQPKLRPILTIFQTKDFGDIVGEEIVAELEIETQQLLLRLDPLNPLKLFDLLAQIQLL